jgi:hypothetical protein
MRDRDVRLVLTEVRAAVHRLRLSRRRLRRWAVGSALGVVGGSCLALLTALVLARSAPSWWRTIRRDDPATITLGTNVENAVLKVLSKNRASDTAGTFSEPWSFEVTPAQANAWLNVRLPKWLANQKDDFHWPKDLTDLQVEFGPDRITIGARVRSAKHDQVLSATLRPRLDAAGSLYAPATWVSLGRLAIPADWVLDRAAAEQYIPRDISRLPETEALLKAFAGEGAVVQRATFRLGDGRRVRILALTPRDGMLRITCQTEMQ